MGKKPRYELYLYTLYITTKIMKSKNIFVLFVMMLALPFMPSAQVTISLNQTFEKDSTVMPFTGQPFIYSLKLSGIAHLNTDTSLIRVILNDHLGDPYLIFETYSLLADTFTIALADTSDETKYLKKITPASISVQVINASVHLATISYDTVLQGNEYILMLARKNYMDSCKVARINQRIVEEKMYWRAGSTVRSKQFYRERSQGATFYLPYDGYDYYKGGIFEIIGRRNYTYASSNMVSSFDWRNRHGANQPGSPYNDGDQIGEGWMTPA